MKISQIIDKLFSPRACYASWAGYKETDNAEDVTMLNLDRACFPDVVPHELMHVLGAIHTQNRPDRDHFLDINFDNIEVNNILHL